MRDAREIAEGLAVRVFKYDKHPENKQGQYEVEAIEQALLADRRELVEEIQGRLERFFLKGKRNFDIESAFAAEAVGDICKSFLGGEK